ncbi:MAG: hypothetical protein Q8O68_00250 [Candidatus Daviesbacteria bacterium]|nr:hypothetical protein [Candidatus Daviesbacteria bacterium]
MSKKQQLDKNMKLTVKLADFIASHPEVNKSIPSGASIVPFSASDNVLNKMNENLIPGLKEEGKIVVKAKETKNKKEPWEFIIP